MGNRSSRFTSIRMIVAIQAFSFLLVIITGFFSLEIGSLQLNDSLKSDYFYTFKGSIQKLFLSSHGKSHGGVAEKQLNVTQIEAALNEMRFIVLICGLVAFVSGVVFSYAIKDSMNRLTRGLHSVAEGNFSGRLEFYSQEEINQLVKAYNRMVSSVNRYLLETSIGAIFAINRDGIITAFNPVAEIVFDCDSRDAVGRHFTEIFPINEKNRRFINILMKGIEKEEPRALENVSISTDRQERIATKVIPSILSGDRGKLLEVVVDFGDLEQVKEVKTQLERVHRLASLGSLMTGLAHEIRNPLGSLKGLTQLIAEDLPEGDRKQEYTQIMIQEIDRLNRIMEDSLSFAHPSVRDFEPRDINEIIRSSLLLVEANFRSKALKVIERYDPSLPKVTVDPRKLTQAILNILNNAFEATPDKGCVLIETRRGEGGSFEGPSGSAPSLDTVIIDFYNSGKSISCEESKRIFDPFFTTKEKGIGLGLPIAQQVVTAHGGILQVVPPQKANHEEGVIFRMELPVRGCMDRLVNESPVPS